MRHGKTQNRLWEGIVMVYFSRICPTIKKMFVADLSRTFFFDRI